MAGAGETTHAYTIINNLNHLVTSGSITIGVLTVTLNFNIIILPTQHTNKDIKIIKVMSHHQT